MAEERKKSANLYLMSDCTWTECASRWYFRLSPTSLLALGCCWSWMGTSSRLWVSNMLPPRRRWSMGSSRLTLSRMASSSTAASAPTQSSNNAHNIIFGTIIKSAHYFMFSLIDFFCDTTKVMQKKKLSWKKKRKEKKSYARVCVRTGQRERKAHSFFLSMKGNLGKSRRRKKALFLFFTKQRRP